MADLAASLPNDGLTSLQTGTDPTTLDALGKILYPKGWAGGLFGAGNVADEILHARPGDPNVAAMLAGGFAGPIKAWHGTPHTFEPVEGNPFGSFDTKAIGSGEGAQVYGWGHYVAGNKGVAESYQKDLTGSMPHYNGKPYATADFPEPTTEAQRTYIDVLRSASDPFVAADKAWKSLGAQANMRSWLDVSNLRDQIASKTDYISTGGNLYHVQVHPDESELLDWYKPLAEQPAGVQAKIEDLAGQTDQATGELAHPNLAAAWGQLHDSGLGSAASGADLYHALLGDMRVQEYDRSGGDMRRSLEGAPPLASERLHEAGIPGIRYLDQGSRDLNLNHGGVTINGINVTGPEDLPKTKFSSLRNLAGPDWEAAHSAVSLLHKYGDLDKTLTALDNSYATFDTKYANSNPSLADNLKNENRAARMWIEENKSALSFAPPKPSTSNYVIFHPSNLTITGRNGEVLEPVSHDPFTQTPVDHDPFASETPGGTSDE